MNRLVKVFAFVFIVTMLCLAVIVGACLNYSSRIDRIELAIGNKLQPNDSIGFQAYVDKFDIQSNWFILYVTLLFGIFAIFGYTFIVKIVDGKVRDINKQVSNATKATDQKNKEYYEKYAHDLRVFEEENNDLKVVLFISISNYHGMIGDTLEKEGDLYNAFRSWIASAKYLKFAKDINNSISNEKNIELKLAQAYGLIREIDPNDDLVNVILRNKQDVLNEMYSILSLEHDMVKKFTALIISAINLLDLYKTSQESAQQSREGHSDNQV